jgi:CDP-diacylglycerol--serine O-phosphatidyltransferase
MKQIPNLFTLLNLVFGCIAIVFILQTGENIVQLDDSGASQVFLPEKIWWGALFIFGAAIIDFFDGFLARLLNSNSEMGKQLDSLSDIVSFGVAPSMILYQLLRIGYAQEEAGLDVSLLALFPAFIFASAAAWRLAKFNISTDQTNSFRGVPSPAAALVVASFPLIVFYQYYGVQTLLINKWVLYGIILVLSYLMVGNSSFMAMKFTDYSVKNNLLKYVLVLLSIVCILFLKWLAVPVIFILYLAISFFAKDADRKAVAREKQMTDITV